MPTENHSYCKVAALDKGHHNEKQYLPSVIFLTSKSGDYFTENMFNREKDPMLTLTKSAVI